jgi:hypothetical protein
VKKLVIDRSRWLRGEDASQLMLADGRLCCLGFHALSCGYSEEEIKGKAYPKSLHLLVRPHPDTWLFDETGDESRWWESFIANINDDRKITDADRETRLVEVFKSRGGIEVEFVDGPVPQ